MAIKELRSGPPSDFSGVIELFGEFFSTHDIFRHISNSSVWRYVQESSLQYPLLIVEEDGNVQAAMYLVRTEEDRDKTHSRWKFRHFAWRSEKAFEELIVEAESRIRSHSRTSKIENTVAASEPGIELYLTNGYEVEAELKNHYRFNETCFVLGKTLS